MTPSAARQFIEPRLVLASHNSGKLAEFQRLFAPYPLELTGAAALGLAEPAETGATFAENALIKARAAVAAAAPAAGGAAAVAAAVAVSSAVARR